MKGAGAALAAGLWLALGAQAEATEGSTVVVDQALKKDLETIRDARVFFGHQSVGKNLLDGVAALAQEAGIELHLGEATLGANRDPRSKFEAFARMAEGGVEADLMVMKLCFVDIDPNTDTDALLAAYRDAVARVRKAKPGVKLLHVTTPLTGRGTGLKSWLRRTLGRSVWDDDTNAKRLAYNRGLRAMFPADPIFDLAALESTRPDGSREEYAVNGQPVPMLWPGYSDDNGHLNEAAKRVAARAFVAALAEALRR